MPSNESRSWKLMDWIMYLVVAVAGMALTASMMQADMKADIARNKEAIKWNSKKEGDWRRDIRERIIRIETHLLGEPK
jgi:hypothetical protein